MKKLIATLLTVSLLSSTVGYAFIGEVVKAPFQATEQVVKGAANITDAAVHTPERIVNGNETTRAERKEERRAARAQAQRENYEQEQKYTIQETQENIQEGWNE